MIMGFPYEYTYQDHGYNQTPYIWVLPDPGWTQVSCSKHICDQVA